MQPIRPPSKVLLDRMARLHSMPPSGMTGEQARTQVALHREEALEERKRGLDGVPTNKHCPSEVEGVRVEVEGVEGVEGVSSIRSKQGVFLIFSQGWIWARRYLPGREFRFGLAVSGPCKMLASGTEGGDGGGWWQAPGADRFAGLLRPFCLADWCDVPSTCLPGRSILKPWSVPGLFSPGRIGGDRCLGLLTQAVAFPRGIPTRAIRSPRLRFASPVCGSFRWWPRVGGKVVHWRWGRSMP
jgi:hypothetical protein